MDLKLRICVRFASTFNVVRVAVLTYDLVICKDSNDCLKIQHKFKLAESEKEIADRKSREKNIILFKADEPDTNLIEERLKSDKEFVRKIINEMHFETSRQTVGVVLFQNRLNNNSTSNISF